jgi:CHAT domain-containing protein
MNKAEAIRLAQKEMIDGKIKASGKSNGCRAESFSSGAKKDEFKCDPNAPFSHPYFWSPFVLIGNWR